MSDGDIAETCPICTNPFPRCEIERHVNKCIFLNSVDDQDKQKRKRSPSPSLYSSTKVKTTVLQSSPPKKPKNEELVLGKLAASSCSSESEDFKQSLDGNRSASIPLSKQLQPKLLSEFFGQNHVLGKNTVLRTLLECGDIPNMILWGPPGCGKTSLSNVIREMCKSQPKRYKFVDMCAASSGVKEVQNVVSAAKLETKFGRKTILFMDEIHRFNKRQQDTFLLCVEKGEIILIGATTENPSFALNSALLSRCRVIVMQKLETEDLYAILERAAKELRIEVVGMGEETNNRLCIERDALKWLADTSDGDARIALGNLELLLQHIGKTNNFSKPICVDDIRDGIKKSHMLYDRQGEEHYNIISAMHKSIRGSDANAALYWTTRMIVSGEDPRFIARRLVRAASEDIGNADPNALQLAVTTMQGCQLLGMPEADCLLAQCAIYLARAPKSREADSALANAKRTIAECKGLQPSVPMHLRNAPTKLMKDLGYGKLQKGTKRSFMPPGLEDVDFFK